MPIDTVRWCLGLDEDKVLALIETGKLRWAWDIAVRSTGANIRQIRVWSPCVAALRSGGDGQPGVSPDEVVAAVIGGGPGKSLRTSQVRALLVCSHQTVCRLLDRGELHGERTRTTRWVSRQSLAEFLSRRFVE